MPTFPPDLPSPQIDFLLIRDSTVTLFWREHVFDNAVSELRALGYNVAVFDASGIASVDELLISIGEALQFPDYYGANLDALADCLRDVAAFDYGADPDAAGTVLAFRHFDRAVRLSPDRAEAILDIFTSVARLGLLYGHPMMVIVQSDDPDLSFGPLGAQVAIWNAREQMDAVRHPSRWSGDDHPAD